MHLPVQVPQHLPPQLEMVPSMNKQWHKANKEKDTKQN